MPIIVDKSLQEAITEFREILTADQRKELNEIKAVPDTVAVMMFTAELDRANPERRGSSIASRLYHVLRSVQEFSAIVDTFISAHPDIAALVWGSVKLTMLVIVNFTSYFEALSDLFSSFNKLCPRFAQYQILYPSSHQLQSALCNFHASIIRCCKQAVQVIQRPWQIQIANALWQSIQQEFEPCKDEIRKCSEEVNEAIKLAQAQAIHQDQQLQIMERQAASRNRRELQSFFSRTQKETEDFREWRIQRDERRSRIQRQNLLDSISTYGYQTTFLQARKKRYSNTAQWLTQTPEFNEWKNDIRSSVLWCFGKLGSGKTVLTASVVDHLCQDGKNRKDGVFITYFFPRFDECISLKAETILRSVIRQTLDADNLPKEIESYLKENSLSEVENLQILLRKRIAGLKTFYIIIDALDECEKCERDILLDTLSSLIASGSNIKLFLASRESISEEIKRERGFPFIQHVSMNCPEAHSDIAIYIKESVDGKRRSGDLVVGDENLIEEIICALIQGAQGMFLWVVFLIDEVCSQYCDDDIRRALKNLPKDLTETFNRALYRILARGKENIARQTFQWVAVARRPLSLEELREALSIEPCQPYSRPERLINGMGRIVAWCENLIHLDEELEVIQFIHHTVREYFLSQPTDTRLKEFHLDLQDVDHYVGEICVTYLNLNDFKTTLTRRPQPMPSLTPSAITETALGRGWQSSTVVSVLRSIHKGSPQKVSEIDVVGVLASYDRDGTEHSMEKLQLGHPFLMYASENWLLHTRRFEDGKSRTWNLWKQMIHGEHGLGRAPWTYAQFTQGDPAILKWADSERHYAILRFMLSSNKISQGDTTDLIQCSVRNCDIELLDIVLGAGHCSTSDVTILLRSAAENGYLIIVERLLAANADVNDAAAEWDGRTALQAAAGGGHLQVVEKLLAANADINAVGGDGLTALQAAAGGGHLQVIERLLAANADVNADAAERYGRTALQAAAGGGHLQVVKRLLIANADVNAAAAEWHGQTALQAAAGGGHLEVVERLLAANANVNTAGKGGRTAIQVAARGGHLEVVERLLSANADVNAAGKGGRTAIQAAAGGGHLQVVERLLAANADVNAAATAWHGRTALQAAAEGGHLQVVERLLAANADVNAAAAEIYGRTALEAAVEGGCLQIVTRLKSAGARE